MIEEGQMRERAPHWFDRNSDRGLKSGDGGGTSGGMESRLTRLEVEGEQYRRDISEIKTSLKKLDDLPTKRDLTNNTLAIVTISLAVLAITVGGIVGGLAWLDRPAPPSAVAPAA